MTSTYGMTHASSTALYQHSVCTNINASSFSFSVLRHPLVTTTTELVYKAEQKTGMDDMALHKTVSSTATEDMSAGATFTVLCTTLWPDVNPGNHVCAALCLQAVLAATWLVSGYTLGQSKSLGHGCSLHSGVALSRLLALYHSPTFS